MRRLALCVLAVALVSCRDGSREGTYSVRDSSGIQIVSNPATVRGDSGCVAVDSVPMLTIGGAGAEGPYDVQRAGSALRLAEGGVVVLNGATSELRFFDSAGRYVRTFGRTGSGPGEFQSLAGLLWFGADTLMVADYGTARISLVSAAGALLGTIGLRGEFGGGLLGRLADGSLVFSAGRGYSPGAQTGRRRDPVYLLRVSREGAVLDTLGAFPDWESYVEGDAQRVMVTSAPFGRGTYFALTGGRVFVADNAEYRVRVYADGRRLERIIERAYEPVALTAAEVNREKAQRVRSTTRPQFLAQIERMYQRDRLPETLPAYGPVAVAADGWVWISGYSPAEDGRVRWNIFDAAGRLRCALALPSAFSVREIGHDFLLGVQTDADELQQVRLYGLRRSAQGPN